MQPQLVINVFVEGGGDALAAAHRRIGEIVSSRSESSSRRGQWDHYARACRYGAQSLAALLGHPPSGDELESFNGALDNLRAWERRADSSEGDTTLVSASNEPRPSGLP